MIDVLALATLLPLFQSSAPAAQPVLPPYVGDWVVEIVDNIHVLPESRITLHIQGGLTGTSSLSGQASCNNYRGSISASGEDRIDVRLSTKTMKVCDPARMSEERDFFDVLSQITGYDVRRDGTLVLRSACGKTIVARRAPPTQRD